MSWFNRLRNNPAVDYNEDIEEEDLEEGLDFDSPLPSPQRPVHTREGSPQELAHPTLNDNVDEELNQIRQTLQNIGHTPLFRREDPEGEDFCTTTKSDDKEIDPEGEDCDDDFDEEIVEEGLVVGEV